MTVGTPNDLPTGRPPDPPADGADVGADPPNRLAHVDLDVYVSDYARARRRGGGPAAPAPARRSCRGRAGSTGPPLSGGTDVDPARYGAAAER